MLNEYIKTLYGWSLPLKYIAQIFILITSTYFYQALQSIGFLLRYSNRSRWPYLPHQIHQRYKLIYHILLQHVDLWVMEEDYLTLWGSNYLYKSHICKNHLSFGCHHSLQICIENHLKQHQRVTISRTGLYHSIQEDSRSLGRIWC